MISSNHNLRFIGGALEQPQTATVPWQHHNKPGAHP
jgi:hypothetical protein